MKLKLSILASAIIFALSGCGKNPTGIKASAQPAGNASAPASSQTTDSGNPNTQNSDTPASTSFAAGTDVDKLKAAVVSDTATNALAAQIVSISQPTVDAASGKVEVQAKWVGKSEPIVFKGDVKKVSENNYTTTLKSDAEPDMTMDVSCNDPSCQDSNSFFNLQNPAQHLPNIDVATPEIKIALVWRVEHRTLKLVWPYDTVSIPKNLDQEAKDFITRLQSGIKIVIYSSEIYPHASKSWVSIEEFQSPKKPLIVNLLEIKISLVETKGSRSLVTANPLLEKYGKTYLIGNSEDGEVELEFKADAEAVAAGTFPSEFALKPSERVVAVTPQTATAAAAKPSAPIVPVGPAPVLKPTATKVNIPAPVIKPAPPVPPAARQTSPAPAPVTSSHISRPLNLLNQILQDCSRPPVLQRSPFWEAGRNAPERAHQYRAIPSFMKLYKESLKPQPETKDAADFQTMRTILSEKALPQMISFMTLIESGFEPNAVPGGNIEKRNYAAYGYWQILPTTATGLGITLDERAQIAPSTTAAANYLNKNLSRFHENMPLAITAYKAGEGTMDNALRKVAPGSNHDSGANFDDIAKYHHDFWEINALKELAPDDLVYVPNLYAAICIAKYPGAHGFENIDLGPQP